MELLSDVNNVISIIVAVVSLINIVIVVPVVYVMRKTIELNKVLDSKADETQLIGLRRAISKRITRDEMKEYIEMSQAPIKISLSNVENDLQHIRRLLEERK